MKCEIAVMHEKNQNLLTKSRFIMQIKLMVNLLKKMQPREKSQIKTSLAECISGD